MHKPSRVEVAGPLAAHAIGFRRELAGRGYSRSRATGLLLLMARLSRWLAERGRVAGELSDMDLERFVSHRRVVSRDDRQLTAQALVPLLEYLRGLGVVPRPVPVVALTPRERLLDAFVAYLAADRGLADSPIGNYRSVAARFLATGSGWPDGIAGLCAEQVNGFVLAEAARCSAGSLRRGAVTPTAMMFEPHAGDAEWDRSSERAGLERARGRVRCAGWTRRWSRGCSTGRVTRSGSAICWQLRRSTRASRARAGRCCTAGRRPPSRPPARSR